MILLILILENFHNKLMTCLLSKTGLSDQMDFYIRDTVILFGGQQMIGHYFLEIHLTLLL